MGIPAYLRHVVTKHRSILKKLCDADVKVDNLYLDSNSDVYDALRDLINDGVSSNDKNFEAKLIKATCKRIEGHIIGIKPRICVMVAFDGTAPVAKLDQQRQRRIKTAFEKRLKEEIGISASGAEWSSAAITPGTAFMESLANEATKYFKAKRFPFVKKIIVSTSKEEGEGEHKIFEKIRSETRHMNETTVVKGLDADLIMLTLNHLRFAKELYLTRETPHFIRSIDKSLEPNETYLLDMPAMGAALTEELNDGNDIHDESQKQRMFDYILICFFLGNDFLPHFPTLNIRTTGIDRMLSAYKVTLSKSKENLTSNEGIVWKNVRTFVSVLAENERDNFIAEDSVRAKQSKYAGNPRDGEDPLDARFQSLPLIDMRREESIRPSERGWEDRYYMQAFGEVLSEERKREVCINYIEGIEWTFKYYSSGCPDWRWTYRYAYPPLFSDLAKYVPYLDVELVPQKPANPVSSNVQLAYVLPPDQLHLLPEPIHKALLAGHSEWYKQPSEFLWLYCRYFWESHPIMPDINLEMLELCVEST